MYEARFGEACGGMASGGLLFGRRKRRDVRQRRRAWLVLVPGCLELATNVKGVVDQGANSGNYDHQLGKEGESGSMFRTG